MNVIDTNDFSMEPFNFSETLINNETSPETSLAFPRHVIYRVMIPLVCSFGIVSNCIDLAVFGRRWGKQSTTSTEKAAMVGLLALAMSDMVFCIFGIPAAFMNSVLQGNSPLALVAFYYVSYRGALLNMALYSSTWCIVLISLERYIAVCHPFQARLFIRVWKTVILHLSVVICAVLISLPEFLKFSIFKLKCSATYSCYFREPRVQFFERDFLIVYKLLWATVGTFIPLGIMVFCNIRLLVEIYHSKKKGLTDPDRYCTTKLTLTVAGIISMFLVLVCPSMILSFVDTVLFLADQRDDIHTPQVAMMATNLLQAVKFSSNFIWYCAVNSQFREAFRCVVRRHSRYRKSSESLNKVKMTLLTSPRRVNNTPVVYEV